MEGLSGLLIGGISMNRLMELKQEIEVQKGNLIKLLESDAEIEEIYELNYRLDDLIVKYYRILREIEKLKT